MKMASFRPKKDTVGCSAVKSAEQPTKYYYSTAQTNQSTKDITKESGVNEKFYAISIEAKTE